MINPWCCAGGVARNVAEALAHLLKSSSQQVAAAHSLVEPEPLPLPLLVSAVGDDVAGGTLLQHWRSSGWVCCCIPIHAIQSPTLAAVASHQPRLTACAFSCRLSTAGISQIAGASTPTVAVVFDRQGDVAASVADVALMEQPGVLLPLLRQPAVASALSAASVVMLDGNLPSPVLEVSEGSRKSAVGRNWTDACCTVTPLAVCPDAPPPLRPHLILQEACRQAAAAGVPVWFEPVSVP